MEDKVPLYADHSMIVKFNTRNAAGYRTALDKLRQFEKDAPKARLVLVRRMMLYYSK
jgi:hypothetical protein